MNGFWVEFAEDTTINQIAAGLNSVPAFNITIDNDTRFFDAAWGTSSRDLNNLRGRIEIGSGRNSVTGIGLQDDDLSDDAKSKSDV